MHTQHATRTLPFILMTCCLLAFCLAPLTVSAQSDTPAVTQTAEYDIGFDCPVSTTFSPDQTVLWVLMNNCGSGGFTLRGFNIADGSPVKADDKNFAEALTPLKDKWIYSDTKPLAFTPDGTVDIRYNDPDTYDALNLRLTLTGDEPVASDLALLTNDTIQKLIPGYAGYTEIISYNNDHTLAAIPDTTTFHIIDLKSGKELFQIDSQPTSDYSKASFSQDNQQFHISILKNADDVNDNRSALKVYRLPDGKLSKTYDVPSYLNYISPDGRYIVGYVGGQFDAALLITNLETGSSTQPILLNEPSHLVTECLNSGKKVTGVDFRTSGELPMIDLIWLPDSSGFLTVNSYGGEAAGGGSICIFNYSRLRQYKVS